MEHGALLGDKQASGRESENKGAVWSIHFYFRGPFTTPLNEISSLLSEARAHLGYRRHTLFKMEREMGFNDSLCALQTNGQAIKL